METPSGRNNFRPGYPIIGCSRGGGAEAADDWLEAPEPAERTWGAECRPDGLRQDRALPVRVVSRGPVGGRGLRPGGGGGGGAARALRAPQRGPFTVLRPSFIAAALRTRRALGPPYLQLLTARLTSLHPSKPVPGRVFLVAFLSLRSPAQGPCFVFNLCAHQTQHEAWHRVGNQDVLVNDNTPFLLLSGCPPQAAFHKYF